MAKKVLENAATAKKREDELIARVTDRMAGPPSVVSPKTGRKWDQERKEAQRILNRRLSDVSEKETRDAIRTQLDKITTPYERDATNENVRKMVAEDHKDVMQAAIFALDNDVLRNIAQVGEATLNTAEMVGMAGAAGAFSQMPKVAKPVTGVRSAVMPEVIEFQPLDTNGLAPTVRQKRRVKGTETAVIGHTVENIRGGKVFVPTSAKKTKPTLMRGMDHNYEGPQRVVEGPNSAFARGYGTSFTTDADVASLYAFYGDPSFGNYQPTIVKGRLVPGTKLFDATRPDSWVEFLNLMTPEERGQFSEILTRTKPNLTSSTFADNVMEFTSVGTINHKNAKFLSKVLSRAGYAGINYSKPTSINEGRFSNRHESEILLFDPEVSFTETRRITQDWSSDQDKAVRQNAKGGDVSGSKTRGPDPQPAPEPTSPARIVINPKVFKDKRDGLCTAYNEAFRVLMEVNGFDPQAEPTEEQRKFFSDTAYADDELMLRRTILARICTFDTSVEDPTDEQLDEAVEFLDAVMEMGAPQTEEEQANVQRIRDIIAKVRQSPRPEKKNGPAPGKSQVEPGGGAEEPSSAQVEDGALPGQAPLGAQPE